MEVCDGSWLRHPVENEVTPVTGRAERLRLVRLGNSLCVPVWRRARLRCCFQIRPDRALRSESLDDPRDIAVYPTLRYGEIFHRLLVTPNAANFCILSGSHFSMSVVGIRNGWRCSSSARNAISACNCDAGPVLGLPHQSVVFVECLFPAASAVRLPASTASRVNHAIVAVNIASAPVTMTKAHVPASKATKTATPPKVIAPATPRMIPHQTVCCLRHGTSCPFGAR